MMAMELSPLQLKQLIFTRLHVEAAAGLDQVEAFWAPTFDFTGVTLKVDVSLSTPESAPADEAPLFMLAVHLSIPNEPGSSVIAPYAIDMAAQAWFELDPAFASEKREELVRINGVSLVLGAMREMVQQMTARSAFGPMLLPTLRFLPER